jgi:Uma2 family endonuclease
MATLTAPAPARPDQHLYLENVEWAQYESMLAAIGDGALRVTYDSGRMEVMSPLPEHETERALLSSFVGIIALERNIPMRRLGSMTIRRRDLQKGLEPDSCFYIQRESLVRHKMDFDFARDPAPDLVVEVEVTNRSIDKWPIYAALGVGELWVYGLAGLSFLLLDGGGYRPVDQSASLPGITRRDLTRFIAMWRTMDETAMLRSFRDWVRETA